MTAPEKSSRNLAPAPDDLYLADFSYTQGLLYFVYYPDGTGVSETAMRCYIDARPDHDHSVQVVE